MFNRTSGGLSSVHLFYDVDIIIYCEGIDRSDASSTFDEVFWTSVMQLLGVRCVCKSLGCKDTVLALHSEIVDNGLKNTILALDLDYDWFFNKKIDHPAVIYTYGYSWENDAILMMSMHNVLNLFINAVSIENYKIRLEQFKTSLSPLLRRVCVLDIRYFECSRALFDRTKPQEIILTKPADFPKINVNRLLRAARNICDIGCSVSKSQYENIDGFVRFFGKSVLKLIYYWFVKISRDSDYGRKVSYDTFLGSLLSSMRLEGASDLELHYRSSVERFRDYVEL